ncbi:MFS transporter [Streptomyces sp. NPDC091371]|uniref:MFS transporter n=1 Tax=Streptomyces sp. NPDC091371 TaxID=3155303 RepID=UPI0034382C23
MTARAAAAPTNRSHPERPTQPAQPARPARPAEAARSATAKPEAPAATTAPAATAALEGPASTAAPKAQAAAPTTTASPEPLAAPAPAAPAPAPRPATGLDRRLIALLSLTCAIAVGNIYFPQAVSPLVAEGLRTSPDKAAVVVTATQIGYTTGIFLLVPLGDRLPYRRLLVTLLAASGVALLGAALAQSLPQLVLASVLVGVTTTSAQLIGPMTVGLVAEGRRGAVMGTLLSGSIGGMLLARTFSGALGEKFGWQAPYLVAGLVVLCLTLVLARALPATEVPGTTPRIPLRALPVQPLRLLRAEPELRRSAGYQAALFGGFSAVWTCLALLLTGPLYGFGPQALGLVALTGLITMACTPLAGRIVDRLGPDRVNLTCFLATLAAAAVLTAGALGGTTGLIALVLGTLLLDTAMQCGMIANQARFYAARSDSRSALNTAYMTCAYLGGSAGSWLGVQLYRHSGWLGVCLLLALLTAPAIDSARRVRTAKRQVAFPPTSPRPSSR